MSIINFTKKSVAQWFEAQNGNRVGQAGEPGDCPLANYFREHGDPTAEIFHDTRRTYQGRTGDLGYKEIPLPMWARTFVELADTYDDENIEKEREFTGTQALVILKRAVSINRPDLKLKKALLEKYDLFETSHTEPEPEQPPVQPEKAETELVSA